jgi:hypothetical protein
MIMQNRIEGTRITIWDVLHYLEAGWSRPDIPTTPLSLALCFSALTMGKIRLVIAPLDPGHKGEALLNRIRMEGQHNFE